MIMGKLFPARSLSSRRVKYAASYHSDPVAAVSRFGVRLLRRRFYMECDSTTTFGVR